MTVPKQRRTRTHRLERKAAHAPRAKAVTASGAVPHRISPTHPMHKGRDYSTVFGKKTKKKNA